MNEKNRKSLEGDDVSFNLDLGITDLIKAAENKGSGDAVISKDDSSEERCNRYNSLLASGAYSELQELAAQDLLTYGADDGLALVHRVLARSNTEKPVSFEDFHKLGTDLDDALNKYNLTGHSAASEVFRKSLMQVTGDICDRLDRKPALRKQILDNYNLAVGACKAKVQHESAKGAGNFPEVIIPELKIFAQAEDSIQADSPLAEASPAPESSASQQSNSLISEENDVAGKADQKKRIWSVLFTPLGKFEPSIASAVFRVCLWLFAPLFVYLAWIEYDYRGVTGGVRNYLSGVLLTQGERSLQVWHRIEFERVWDEISDTTEMQAPEMPRIQYLGDLKGLSYTFDSIDRKLDEVVKRAEEIDERTNWKARAAAKVENTASAQKPVINTSGPVEPFRVSPEPDRVQAVGRRFPRGKDFVKKHFSGDVRAVDDYYRVEVDTSVFSRPSLSSRRLSDLRRGDRVFVEEDSGEWLIIRSRQGNMGFVYKRDARPETFRPTGN